ncbi:hypothetical protein ACHQM5_018359 [Ranunculus cassubicifolius]
MDCEEIMNIFDFYWFEHKIMSNSTFSPSILEAPKLEIKIESSFPKHSSIPSRHKRSFSDQLSSQTSLDSESSSSPRSVLTPYKLQTILSGKETMEKDEQEQPLPKMEKVAEKPLKLEKSKRRRNRGGVSSKSLSDLEFEELKGFMDLGFVFSEEDKNSSLVSIIPGLQRLGQENQEHQEPEEEEDEEQEPEEEEEEEEKVEEKMVVSRRPYLSEAWEVMNQTRRPYQEIYHYQNYQKQQQPLMNWRFPAMSNEIDMKDHLRSWAHSVASTVR